MDQEKKKLIGFAVQCNAKEINQDEFLRLTGRQFADVWRFYNKECLAAWRVWMAGRRKKFREEKISHEVERRVRAVRINRNRPRIVQQKVPVSIRQLAEIYVRVVRGEMDKDLFLSAFLARFRPQIDAENNRRKKLENYGWDSVDWEAWEKDPLLSQLLSD